MYIEKALQQAAIRWLSEHRGYSELLSDEEAAGDRVDSVGLMDDRIHLVEVKPVMHAGVAHHAGDRPGSIESKIAGVLRAIHAKEQDRVSRAVLGNWNPVHPPVVAMLATRYSANGLQGLEEVLQARSKEWLFDYRIWRWTGCQVEELDRRDLDPPPCPTAYSMLTIDRLIARVQRGRNRTVDELRSMATDRGVGALLDHALGLARELGFRCKPTQTNINLRRRTVDGKRETVVSFYIMGSSPEVGLNVGIWREKLHLADRDLPGRPAPKIGHQTANRYLRTAEELRCLLASFRSG